MPKYKQTLHIEDHKDYVVVHALTDEGDEVKIWVGGDLEVYFHKGQAKAHVKRKLYTPIKLDK